MTDLNAVHVPPETSSVVGQAPDTISEATDLNLQDELGLDDIKPLDHLQKVSDDHRTRRDPYYYNVYYILKWLLGAIGTNVESKIVTDMMDQLDKMNSTLENLKLDNVHGMKRGSLTATDASVAASIVAASTVAETVAETKKMQLMALDLSSKEKLDEIERKKLEHLEIAKRTILDVESMHRLAKENTARLYAETQKMLADAKQRAIDEEKIMMDQIAAMRKLAANAEGDAVRLAAEAEALRLEAELERLRLLSQDELDELTKAQMARETALRLMEAARQDVIKHDKEAEKRRLALARLKLDEQKLLTSSTSSQTPVKTVASVTSVILKDNTMDASQFANQIDHDIDDIAILGAIHDDAIHDDAIHDDAIHDDAIHDDAIHDDAIHDDVADANMSKVSDWDKDCDDDIDIDEEIAKSEMLDEETQKIPVNNKLKLLLDSRRDNMAKLVGGTLTDDVKTSVKKRSEKKIKKAASNKGNKVAFVPLVTVPLVTVPVSVAPPKPNSKPPTRKIKTGDTASVSGSAIGWSKHESMEDIEKVLDKEIMELNIGSAETTIGDTNKSDVLTSINNTNLIGSWTIEPNVADSSASSNDCGSLHSANSEKLLTKKEIEQAKTAMVKMRMKDIREKVKDKGYLKEKIDKMMNIQQQIDDNTNLSIFEKEKLREKIRHACCFTVNLYI
jgi:hypothetical protein